MIRTSKLSTKFTNQAKLKKYILLLEQYQDVVRDFVDYLWENLDEKFNSPRMISTKDYKSHGLSQRIIKCAATQACGIVRSCTEKKRKLIYVIDKLSEAGEDTTWLQSKLEKTIVTKPTVKSCKSEINSICCDLVQRKSFWFLQLKCLGVSSKIRIPLLPHRQTFKWKTKGVLLNSVLLSKDFVELRFDVGTPKLKQLGKTVGLDQGISTCISLSDGQVSKEDSCGWNLSKILMKLSKKTKGSKGFRKCQEHRKNYINWSINQLNLKDIKQINVEKLYDLRRGKSVDRFRSHWTYTLIIGKLKRFCEEQKVFVKEQSCVYRSQRCNSCGLVRKSSRKGKTFSCSCGYVNDSDLNASLNHEVDLPCVDGLRHLGLNSEGFYWLETGLFSLDGSELTVPDTIKRQSLSNC